MTGNPERLTCSPKVRGAAQPRAKTRPAVFFSQRRWHRDRNFQFLLWQKLYFKYFPSEYKSKKYVIEKKQKDSNIILIVNSNELKLLKILFLLLFLKVSSFEQVVFCLFVCLFVTPNVFSSLYWWELLFGKKEMVNAFNWKLDCTPVLNFKRWPGRSLLKFKSQRQSSLCRGW